MPDALAKIDHKPRKAQVRPLEQLRETGVSTSKAMALHAALRRLVDGTHDHRRSGGRLTVTDLADEAEVGRATAYRARKILAEMKRLMDDIDNFQVIPGSPVLRAKQLEQEVVVLKRKHAEREKRLQAGISRLGNRVNALEIERRHLQVLLDAQIANVTPISTKMRDG
jgi:hypothetical protein